MNHPWIIKVSVLLVYYYLCIIVYYYCIVSCSKCKCSLFNLAGLLTLSQFYCILSSLIKVTRVKKAKDAAK